MVFANLRKGGVAATVSRFEKGTCCCFGRCRTGPSDACGESWISCGLPVLLRNWSTFLTLGGFFPESDVLPSRGGEMFGLRKRGRFRSPLCCREVSGRRRDISCWRLTNDYGKRFRRDTFKESVTNEIRLRTCCAANGARGMRGRRPGAEITHPRMKESAVCSFSLRVCLGFVVSSGRRRFIPRRFQVRLRFSPFPSFEPTATARKTCDSPSLLHSWKGPCTFKSVRRCAWHVQRQICLLSVFEIIAVGVFVGEIGGDFLVMRG